MALLPLVTANPLATGVDRAIRTAPTETRCHHHDGRLATVALENRGGRHAYGLGTGAGVGGVSGSLTRSVPLREQDLPKPLLVQHGATGDFLLFVREGSEGAVIALKI